MHQPNHQPLLTPGTKLGEWIIDGPLASGPFATLYRGHGAHLGDPVVIKEYFPAAVVRRLDGRVATLEAPGAAEAYGEALERFIVQARLLRGLDDPPHLAKVHSVIKANGTAYMVMAKADGAPIADATKIGAVAVESIIRQLAQSLADAHAAGIVHGHIVPGNILIDAAGVPTLIGFGSIRFDTGDSKALTPFTPPYAALEQYVGAYPVGPWTDIYALGIIAYQAITGQTPPEVLGRTGSPRNRRLAAGGWDAPPALLAAVDAAIEIAPQSRPQSMADWLAMLDSGAVAAPEPARAPPPPEPAAVLMPLFPLPAAAPAEPAAAAEAVVPKAQRASLSERLAEWRGRLPDLRPVAERARGFILRHRIAVAASAVAMAIAAPLALLATGTESVAPPAPRRAVTAAPSAVAAPAAVEVRDRHGVIIQAADAQAKGVAADLAQLRDRARELSPDAAAVLLSRADEAEAGVAAALARLNDTTRQLAEATAGADTAPLLAAAAAAGGDIDAERRTSTRLLADAEAAARTNADRGRRDRQAAELDRALSEARAVQAQLSAALGSTTPALKAKAADAGASLDRQARVADDPTASAAALKRATRSVEASRRTLASLLAEANRPAAPVAAAAGSVATAAADPQTARAARSATRAYDDVMREYMALRGSIERAYAKKPASHPDVVTAYAAATEVYRGLTDLAPKRDAVAQAPDRAEAERRLAELKAALKPLDRRLDSGRRALQR